MFADILEGHAAKRPTESCFELSVDGETVARALTWAGLHGAVNATAARLSALAKRGDRVLLLTSHLESFLAGLFGCLQAGLVAVPAHVMSRSLDHLRAVSRDARPRLVATSRAELKRLSLIRAEAPELASLKVVAVDAPEPFDSAWVRPQVEPTDLAMLQYTSGSTGRPRGVEITHANFFHNAVALSAICRYGPGDVGVSWLPLYHDMGLMGGVLQPVFAGARAVLMPPAAFVQRPYRWLSLISRFHAVASIAPNFAFDMCVDRIPEAERGLLDLTSWRSAICGAEPVRAATLGRFAEAFASAGFRPHAFIPAYGLAEATLAVTVRRSGGPPWALNLDAEALRKGKATLAPGPEPDRLVVSCGDPLPGVTVRVVDARLREPVEDGAVGEIWVRGGGVARGYWNAPHETRERMSARLAGEPRADWLRTGDLGFLWRGELFVVGRLTDMIVLRGRNHAPQDVEDSAERACAALSPHGSAAFLVPVGRGGEGLVVVAEARRESAELSPAAVAALVRSAVAADHGLELHGFGLLKPGALPRTTSGKVRRGETRRAWLNDDLQVSGVWRRPEGQTAAPSAPPSGDRERAAAIEAWLALRCAQILGQEAGDLPRDVPAIDLGLGSHDALTLAGELAEWLGRAVPPSIFIEDAPTLAAVAERLAGLPAGASAVRVG